MKHLVSLLSFALLSSAALAQKIEESLAVVGHHPQLLRELRAHPELTVDHLHADGFELYGPRGLSRFLDERGVLYYPLASQQKEFETANYPSFREVEARLREAARRFPHLAKLESIGKSVQGRDLWVMKLTKDPQRDHARPEFKYISSMHGDEITGRELCLRFIDDLLESYGKDPLITELLDHTEIYVLPSMNPDGSELRQRANANHIDLNRNFPEAVRNEPNSPEGRQPEVRALMSFQAQRNFSLSANFHGGAVVVNYPWDARYGAHPDHELVRALSVDYAALNPEMRDSRRFAEGVTNGAAWYVLYGGMQDWSYVWHNDLQVTVELSDSKWPNYAQIPAFYQRNRESMLAFAQAVHQGAGFRLANPASAGRVEIYGAEGGRVGSFAFTHGEFYKVLPTGRYRFVIEVDGKTREQVFEVRPGIRPDAYEALPLASFSTRS